MGCAAHKLLQHDQHIRCSPSGFDVVQDIGVVFQATARVFKQGGFRHHGVEHLFKSMAQLQVIGVAPQRLVNLQQVEVGNRTACRMVANVGT